MPENNGNRANNNRRPQTATRNWVAKHQWQRGGVHEKTNKAKRQTATKTKNPQPIRCGFFLLAEL